MFLLRVDGTSGVSSLSVKSTGKARAEFAHSCIREVDAGHQPRTSKGMKSSNRGRAFLHFKRNPAMPYILFILLNHTLLAKIISVN
jgi:hypothetical protein